MPEIRRGRIAGAAQPNFREIMDRVARRNENLPPIAIGFDGIALENFAAVPAAAVENVPRLPRNAAEVTIEEMQTTLVAMHAGKQIEARQFGKVDWIYCPVGFAPDFGHFQYREAAPPLPLPARGFIAFYKGHRPVFAGFTEDRVEADKWTKQGLRVSEYQNFVG